MALAAGTGKLRVPGSLEPGLRESLNRAYAYLQTVKDKLGLTQILAQKDIQAEAVDLSGGRVECACGVAFYVAMVSALYNRRVLPGTIVLGDLTVQGNIKGVNSVIEPLQLSLDNGAQRALLPLANKNQLASLPEEVAERLDVAFYGDPDRAVSKALEG